MVVEYLYAVAVSYSNDTQLPIASDEHEAIIAQGKGKDVVMMQCNYELVWIGSYFNLGL